MHNKEESNVPKWNVCRDPNRDAKKDKSKMKIKKRDAPLKLMHEFRCKLNRFGLEVTIRKAAMCHKCSRNHQRRRQSKWGRRGSLAWTHSKDLVGSLKWWSERCGTQEADSPRTDTINVTTNENRSKGDKEIKRGVEQKDKEERKGKDGKEKKRRSDSLTTYLNPFVPGPCVKLSIKD